MLNIRPTFKSFLIISACLGSAFSATAINWRESFDSQEAFDAFTVIDSNRDNIFWEWSAYNKWARVSYNDDLQMDDWLITPPFQLEPGVYKFSLDARNYMGPEKFEVFAGSAPTVASMNIPVIAPTVVNTESMQTYSGQFTITQAGEWYIGIHGISDPDKLYLDIDNLTLTQGVSEGSPRAVTDLSILPDSNGLPNVAISCILPSLNTAGSQLTSIDKVEILCDNVVIVTSNGNPGELFQTTVMDAPLGRHSFTVLAYADNQRGAETTVEVFVGPNTPAPVSNLTVSELSPGQITLNWTTPATDIEGKPLNPDLITYKVVRYEVMEGSMFYEEDIEGADNITSNQYVHTAIAPDAGQMFTAYGVYAITSAGRSASVKTPLFPVGRDYVTPYCESFAQGSASSVFRSETVSYYQVTPMWSAIVDTESDIKSIDNDGGYLVMLGQNAGDCARFYSGKVDLQNLSSPQLSFFVYNSSNGNASADLNNFEVYVSDGSTFYLQKEFQIKELPVKGWNRISVPLEEFAGKTIQFVFTVTVNNHIITYVDNIQISDAPQVDLAAIDLQASQRVVAGAPFDINLKVVNYSNSPAEEYMVRLLINGEVIDSVEGYPIDPDEIADFSFSYTPEVLDIKDLTISAAVIVDGDEIEENNSTPVFNINVIAPAHPTPTQLIGTVDNGSDIHLSWAEPVIEQSVPEPITDDFESYDSFAVGSAGDWIFVDLDGGPVGKFSDIWFPNVTVENQPASFWVMDSELDGLNSLFQAYSGSKYLAQMFNADKSSCDDWAISPALPGIAQSVSLFAKSYSSYFSEEFSFYYSTGSTDPADFILITNIDDVPNSWTRYEFELPEGAQRFAIRCTSRDLYMLMIDDVSFTPAAGDASLELLGYNIYRNGDKINEQPVDATSYQDLHAPSGELEYRVTALYDRGESLPSNIFNAEISGIDSVAENISANVYGGKGCITADSAGEANIEILNIDGRRVDSILISGKTEIPMTPGIYIVRYNGKSFKVIVR